MKRILKNSLISVLLIAVLTILFGCVSKTTKWDKEVKTFSAITTQSRTNTEWGKNPVSIAITEKTGYAFDIEYCTASWSERLATLLMGNDLPDVIFDCDTSTLQKLLKAGKVLKLDDYIEEYGENIKKVFSPADLKAVRYIDKKDVQTGVYGLPAGYGSVPESADWYIQVQYRLLEEFDYPVIKTLNDLTY